MIPASTNQLLSYTGYRISRSLRFRSSASAYLSRTPASAGNRTTWTWSGWIKRGSLGSNQVIFSVFDFGSGGSVNNQCLIRFTSSDTLEFEQFNTPSYNGQKITTQVFRDTSAWYHIVCVWDTSNATASNRMKIYVNGSQVTTFGTSSDPSPSANSEINRTLQHTVGTLINPNYSSGSPTQLIDGYLAEVNFIDGQALTPSSFGAFDTNGVWQPAKYTGSYGTNGFYLPFSDNSALTTASNAGIGKDFSGNSNYWVTNNISITSGTTYDSMIDSPTNYADGGNGRGNYCTLNPNGKLYTNAVSTVSNGNLTATGSGTILQGTMATLTSGKYYFEMTATTVSGTDDWVGFILASSTGSTGVSGTSLLFRSNGQKFTSSAWASYGSSWASGNVIGCAIDLDNGAIYFAINNTWQTSGDPTSGSAKTGAAFTNATMQISGVSYGIIQSLGTGSGQQDFNFGQRPFTYTPPSGFSALNTQNLPSPTIAAGNKYFDATLYTGDGAASGRNISLNFSPDLMWIKSRSLTTGYHFLFDGVRGATKVLGSSQTAAEYTNGDLGLGTNQFTIGDNGGLDEYNPNKNTATYVAWGWNAGGTGVSNTSGTITSTVSANTSAGFSVVTYTGNGTVGATIAHGLGVKPSLIIAKTRSNSDNWPVYHTSLGATKYIYLNTTGAEQTSSTTWNNTEPTSSVFTVYNDTRINASSYTYVAYCFAPVAGYSSFGSYTGNGSTDGPFVYTGFRPRYVMVKRSDSTGGWVVMDTSRDTYNVAGEELAANTSSAAASPYSQKDFLSNGFKLRNTQTDNNASGGTYIYAAFAENPFKYSRAR